MNTRFEVFLIGEDEVALRAAGEAALDEVERLEAQLSRFRPTSEISRINRHGAERPVPVSHPVFGLLQRARTVWERTEGAFDPTVGRLMREYGFHEVAGEVVGRSESVGAQPAPGMVEVDLAEGDRTVRLRRRGVLLDLGAIGKGYAIDCAVASLRESGITSAFVHGGTSSAYGLGRRAGGGCWKAAIAGPDGPPEEVELCDEALGVSASAGRCEEAAGGVGRRVIDPRRGEVVQSGLVAAVRLPSAADSDALSTALLVLGERGLRLLPVHWPEGRFFLLGPGQNALRPARSTEYHWPRRADRQRTEREGPDDLNG
jgi:thiamine biosynthesis lipoprotein